MLVRALQGSSGGGGGKIEHDTLCQTTVSGYSLQTLQINNGFNISDYKYLIFGTADFDSDDNICNSSYATPIDCIVPVDYFKTGVTITAKTCLSSGNSVYNISYAYVDDTHFSTSRTGSSNRGIGLRGLR